MTLDEFIVDALAREQELLLEEVQDLTPEELGWRAGPEANPIGWILWHMLRVEDMWFQFFVQRQTEIWEKGRLERNVWPAHQGQRLWPHPGASGQFPGFGPGSVIAVRPDRAAGHIGIPEDPGAGRLCGGSQGAASRNVGGGYFPSDHRRGVPAPGAHRLPEGLAAQRNSVEKTRGMRLGSNPNSPHEMQDA